MTTSQLENDNITYQNEIYIIQYTINEKSAKNETDVGPLYERINILEKKIEKNGFQIQQLQVSTNANSDGNQEKAVSIILGGNVEIRPSQATRDPRIPEITKERVKDKKTAPVFGEKVATASTSTTTP